MRIMTRTILVLLFTLTWLMNDVTHLPDMQLNEGEHKVHHSDTITDSEVVLETVRSTIKKTDSELSFFSINVPLTVKVQFIPLKFMSQFTVSNQFIGFISVVQHQSNYLP